MNANRRQCQPKGKAQRGRDQRERVEDGGGHCPRGPEWAVCVSESQAAALMNGSLTQIGRSWAPVWAAGMVVGIWANGRIVAVAVYQGARFVTIDEAVAADPRATGQHLWRIANITPIAHPVEEIAGYGSEVCAVGIEAQAAVVKELSGGARRT